MGIVARGQITIRVSTDTYAVYQSVDKAAVACDHTGRVLGSLALTSVISVRSGENPVTGFTIGTVVKPAGFVSVTVNQSAKTVSYSISSGTTALADTGTINIPVTVDGQTLTISFGWYKVKAGVPGSAGTDSNLLDWVSDWNSGKTVIGSASVITPKIFAGTRNGNGTVTGMAIGRFALSTRNASGTIATETVNGIYGFSDGYRTFEINATGNVTLGRGNQMIRYNAATGRIEFGADVTLSWMNAIGIAKTEAINTAASTAQAKADAAKNAAISTAAADAAAKVANIEIGGDNYLPNGDFRYYSTNNSIGWDNALNGNYTFSNWGSGYNSGVAAPSTGYHAHMNIEKFGFPVLELINKNSVINQTKRWMGISTGVSQKTRLIPGAKYTFSADLMVDTAGAVIHGGAYSSKKGQAGSNFHSGQYRLTTSAINKWERISYTFTLDSDTDLTKPVSFYIYGYTGTEGICWVKNVSLQKGTKGSWVRCTDDVARDVTDAKKAGTDAKAVADAITNKANSEGWSNKLTYIGSIGIFTGTLSANTVNAIRINASQITAGTINAARIDVNSLKASLITAGNIEALTLNVVRGRIGGWSIDSDSVCRGTKNNTAGAYTSASGSVTLGSNGIRGFKWRFDATGAGAVAGGNIAWDAAGNVTFGASVVLNWTTPINKINTALGGTSFPKLTHISSTGIYTGTLTAAQVNAVAINATSITTGTLSVNRLGAKVITAAKIAAGTITATEINVASIQVSVVTASAVNGLTCTFTRGTIGGWTIASSQISKNNIVLGADGSISNGTKWRLANDGSGQVASGNISWNAAGTVTFGSSVSLQWKNDIETAKSTNYGYRYMKTIIINGESDKYYPVVIKGGDQTIKRNLLVRRSYGEQAPSDWANSTTHMGGLILHIRTNFGGWGGINYSWDIYELSETYCRMFGGAAHCGNSCMFAIFLRGGGTTGARYHIYSDQNLESGVYSPAPIPRSPQIAYNQDLIFQSGSSLAYAPVPRTLTVTVENEIRRRRFIVLAQGSDTTLTEHPLTYISGTGIYTGTLIAGQVNAVAINASSITTGTLSADRIAAGSINSTKLNAESIKANIINTAYINGLTCTFARGTIGGWTITGSTIAAGQLLLDKGNKRVVVYGASSGPASGQRVQIYHNSNSDFGIYATDTAGTMVFRLGSANSIAGWTISSSQISKNNIVLGADGAIYNKTKWRLGNDGSGRLANGNIFWDASGNVTFGSSVSLNWTNAANNALNSAKSYADTKKSEAVSAAATDATNKANAAKELASAMAFGKMLYRDPEFRNGNNGISVYNNSGNGTVTITRTGLSSAPNDSKTVLEIRTTGSASPGNGGFNFATFTSNRKVFITRIIARIPAGRNIEFATNSIGTGGSRKWLTPTAGTGDWQEYIYKVVCGTSGFSSTHFFYIGGMQGTAAAPVVWHVAYATVFDTTSSERYTTTIDANGIYTGTIRANQVLIDSALVVGGSSYDGSISVRDANNAIKVTLNRSGITAIAGQIGGWHLNSGAIYASSPAGGHRVYITSSGYLYNDDGSKDYWGLRADGSATFGYGKILFDNDGSGYVANQNIRWDAQGNVIIRGNITANSGQIAGFTVSGNKLINTASDSSIEFSSLMGNASLIINSSSALLSLRADSARTGIYLQTYATGAKGIYIIANAGSLYSIEAYGPMQLGQRSGERWCVPGVLYVGCKYNTGNSTSFNKIWGEGCNVTSCSHLGNSKYRFYHNLGHTNYTVIAQICSSTIYYGFFRLLERTGSYFTIQNIGSSGKPDSAPFDFTIFGRNKW